MLDSVAGCRSQLSHRGLIVILSSSSDPEDLEHVLCEGYAPGLQGTFDAAQAPTAHPSSTHAPAGPTPRHRIRSSSCPLYTALYVESSREEYSGSTLHG